MIGQLFLNNLQFTQRERNRIQHESSYQKQQDMHTCTHNTYGYQDFSLLGAKVPTENFRSRERKFSGTFVPGNESSRELSLPGAKIPRSEKS